MVTGKKQSALDWLFFLSYLSQSNLNNLYVTEVSMAAKIPLLGILQGRLTPSVNGSIQFFPKDNWQNEFAAAKKIGFDCMELLVKRDSGKENPLLSFDGIEAIAQLAQNSGIKVLSVHGFYENSQKYQTTLIRIINASSLIGARTVLISFFGQNVLATETAKTLARLALSPILPYCKTANICLGIETEMSASELLEFVRSFSHPNIGVYYDIGNMASMGVDVAKEISLLGGLICGVHVKDRRANGGEAVPLGEGCADLEGALRVLCQVGYDGPYIIQGARSATVDDITLNRRYFEFCKNLLLKTCGGGCHG